MAGMGLAQALRDAGVARDRRQSFDLRQDQIAKQQEMDAKRRDIEQRMEGAKKSALMVLDESKAKWAMSGAPGEYQPSEATNLKMAEVYGSELAKAGLYDQYMENRARVAPMVLQARGKALQQYSADGDPVKLALTLGPTFFDGKDVVGAEKIGGDENGGPESVSIKFAGSDKPQVMRVDELVKGLKVGLTDPQTWLRNEAAQDLEREKQRVRSDADIKVVRARGEEARLTEGLRGATRENVAGIQADSREAVAATNADARTTAAETRATGAVDAAKARGPAGGGTRTNDEVDRFKARELAARSAAENLRKDLTSKQALLKGAGDKDRPTIQAAIDDLRVKLDGARKEHSDILAEMKRPSATSSGGLSDAAPVASTPMEQARAEAVSTQQPVQYDLGGKKGTIGPGGGLAAVETKPAAAAKKEAPKVDMAKAEKIKADFKAGKIKRDEAMKQLQALGFN